MIEGGVSYQQYVGTPKSFFLKKIIQELRKCAELIGEYSSLYYHLQKSSQSLKKDILKIDPLGKSEISLVNVRARMYKRLSSFLLLSLPLLKAKAKRMYWEARRYKVKEIKEEILEIPERIEELKKELFEMIDNNEEDPAKIREKFMELVYYFELVEVFGKVGELIKPVWSEIAEV